MGFVSHADSQECAICYGSGTLASMVGGGDQRCLDCNGTGTRTTVHDLAGPPRPLRAIELQIDGDGKIWLNNVQIHRADCATRLRHFIGRGPHTNLQIVADVFAPNELLFSIVDDARSAGFAHIACKTAFKKK